MGDRRGPGGVRYAPCGTPIYTANLSATPYDLVVLGQRDLLASTTNSLRVLLRDPKTLAPLVNIPVTLQIVDRAGNKTADLGVFTTDANGDGQPRFTLPDWPDAAYDLRVVAQTPVRPETADLTVTLERESKVMLSTDKPVYQPGQTIHVRSLTLPAPTSVRWPAKRRRSPSSIPRATSSTSCWTRPAVSASPPPTVRSITRSWKGLIPSSARSATWKAGFLSRSKYVLPKFKVAVTPDKPFYKGGDTIKLTVQADYFFGKPVADAEVKVDAKEYIADGPPDVLVGAPTNGKASFDFTIPLLVHVDRPDPDSLEASQVHFAATVTDSAGQKQVASAAPVVSAWPAHVEILPEAGELVQACRTGSTFSSRTWTAGPRRGALDVGKYHRPKAGVGRGP